MTFLPPRSPYGLIQEDLAPNVWLILASCIMLNCTNRRQLEKTAPLFMKRYPDPASFKEGYDVDPEGVRQLISSLGFANRRSKRLYDLSCCLMQGTWSDVMTLPGVGSYAGAAWQLFCEGTVPHDEPSDGALKLYWRWIRKRREIDHKEVTDQPQERKARV